MTVFFILLVVFSIRYCPLEEVVFFMLLRYKKYSDGSMANMIKNEILFIVVQITESLTPFATTICCVLFVFYFIFPFFICFLQKKINNI